MSENLTPAERVIATFEKRKLDRIAIYHSGFSSRVGSGLLGRECYSGGGINQWREATALWNGPDAHAEFVAHTTQDARDLAKVAHCDLIRIGYWRMAAKPAKKIDEHTFFYGDPDGDYSVRQLDPVTELYQEIEKRDSAAPRTMEDIESIVVASEKALDRYQPGPESFRAQFEAREYFGPDYEIPSMGYGLAVSNRDLLWIEAVAARPDLVERHLECQCVRQCRIIEAQKDMPFRIIMGGGDFCGKHGPNYSPKFFHEVMMPRLKRMSDTAHKYGKYTVFATDGNVWPVADDLFDAAGTDGFHEIDRLAGMDHWRLRERHPKLTCFGNISTITLHLGTKDDVIRECRDNAEAALQLGGVLCGVSNQVVPLAPIENVITMIETLAEYH